MSRLPNNYNIFNLQVNVDTKNVVDKHLFEQPIEARVFRIKITAYTCLKVELHGIDTMKSGMFLT